jgi:hypothetical protein
LELCGGSSEHDGDLGRYLSKHSISDEFEGFTGLQLHHQMMLDVPMIAVVGCAALRVVVRIVVSVKRKVLESAECAAPSLAKIYLGIADFNWEFEFVVSHN